MRKTRRTVCLVCYWLNNNKKENMYLTLQKAIQETGKRACVWEWNFAVKGERQISTSCWVFLCLLYFVLCESITKSKCFHTIAGSISFPPSWWHGGASFYQKVDQWMLKMRKARDHSCSLAGSAAAMLSTSLQPNSWLWFSLVVGVWLRELKMPHFSSANKQTNKKPFAYRSLPYLVCDAGESPADLTGDAPSSTSRVRTVIPLSSSAWTVHRNSTLNSSPSTHNPNKREGSGINNTTICKSVKSYLFPLFPL